MTKHWWSSFAAALVWTCFSISTTHAAGLSVPLVAGQHKTIGTVTISNNSVNLVVTYNVTAPNYCLDVTHLYASKAVPTKASPGLFPFKHENLSCVTTDLYVIPLSNLSAGIGTKLYLAAHAGVLSDSGTVESALADLVVAIDGVANPILMTINQGPSGGRWPITISGAGALDGTYDGWCADPDDPFNFGNAYQVNMSVSLDPPWTYINYIANNFGIGDASPSGGSYSICDLQQAYHHFLAGYSFCTYNATQSHIDEIIASAVANGADFIPECNEKLAVFLEPLVAGVQAQIILIPVPCTPVLKGDTAWALIGCKGVKFSTGWGQYFPYKTY